MLRIELEPETTSKHPELQPQLSSGRVDRGLPEFLSVAEIAESLNVAEPTVRRWLRAGDLPSLKAGRAFRVRREDFERWLTERRVD